MDEEVNNVLREQVGVIVERFIFSIRYCGLDRFSRVFYDFYDCFVIGGVYMKVEKLKYYINVKIRENKCIFYIYIVI